MKTSELRLFNFISDHFFMYRVAKIEGGIVGGFSTLDGKNVYPDTLYSLNEENLQGIPLSEEWLLKFGFVKRDDCFYKDMGRKSLSVVLDAADDNNGDIWIGYRDDIAMNYNTLTLCETDFVHQLQNLYFALTGEELIQE
jgi:hypothetical protein